MSEWAGAKCPSQNIIGHFGDGLFRQSTALVLTT